MSGKREMSESGLLVYPKLPMPKGRQSEPRMPRKPSSGSTKLGLVAVFVLGAAGGAAGGYFLGPRLDGSAGALAESKASAETAVAAEQAKTAKLAREVETLTADKLTIEKQLTEAQAAQATLAEKAADAAKRASDLKAAQQKLDAAVARSAGTVTVAGEDIRLSLADSALFKSGGDELTAGGKKVLDKVAAALKELPDKVVAVHGHTDDRPPRQPPNPKPAPPKKGAKAPPAPPPAPPPGFATNWELSAARALAVVHYLQDVQRIQPARLAAHAFSQYRPVSKSKAANRRLELVLTSKPGATPSAKPSPKK